MIDLNTPPPGWQLSGFGPVLSDGKHAYRVPQPRSSVTTHLDVPSFVMLNYELYSPYGVSQVTVRLDGRVTDRFQVMRGSFETFHVGGWAAAGAHRLSVELDCTPCEGLRQYALGITLVPSAAPEVTVGTRGLMWPFAAYRSPFAVPSLPVRFDGKNFYLEVSTTQPIHIPISSGTLKLMHFATVSDQGAYTLTWRAQAAQQPVSYVVRGRPGLTTDHDWRIDAVRPPDQLSVQVSCTASKSACLPVKLYKVTAWGIKPVASSPIALGLSVLLLILALLALYRWLFQDTLSA